MPPSKAGDQISNVSVSKAEDDSEIPLKQTGFSRFPLERMQRLHEMLAANLYPNCRKVAAEFEVSTKTIQRDLNFMRDRLQLPIDYDRALFGFRYTRPIDPSPVTFVPVNQDLATAKIAKGFGPSSLISGGISEQSIDETRDVLVRIVFDAHVAEDVKGIEWHPSQVICPLPNGGVELMLELRDINGLERWVLNWGAHARVIEPDRLRRLISMTAKKILDSYI